MRDWQYSDADRLLRNAGVEEGGNLALIFDNIHITLFFIRLFLQEREAEKCPKFKNMLIVKNTLKA